MESKAGYINERQQEDLRMKAKPPKVLEDIIRKVRIYFDKGELESMLELIDRSSDSYSFIVCTIIMIE